MPQKKPGTFIHDSEFERRRNIVKNDIVKRCDPFECKVGEHCTLNGLCFRAQQQNLEQS